MRKERLRFLLAVIALTTGYTLGAGQQSETLGSVKQKYLNQKVVVIGYVAGAGNLAPEPVLNHWNLASESGGRYSSNVEAYLPATYKGKTANVIAIQLDDLRKQSGVNALGEAISPDDAVNPYFDVIVRFEDGQMAMTAAYPNTISEDIRLASAQNAVAQEMAANLPTVVGKDLFACGFTKLYSIDATLDELMGPSRILKQISDVPFLVPLKVIAAKYNETSDAVILKVKLPDGRDAMAITHGEQLTEEDESFMQRVSGSLLTDIPKKLTPREVAAIKKQSIFRGMSKDALEYSIGFAESENDWGTGGKQLVYEGGLTVYLDNQDKVVDWQSLDNK